MKHLLLATVLLVVVGCGRNNSQGSNTTPSDPSKDMGMSSLEDMSSGEDLGSPPEDMNEPVVQDMTAEDMTPPVEDMPTALDMPDLAVDMPGADPLILRGSVSKGPFVLGSTVTVSELDASGNPTGKTYLTQTNSQLGEFEVEVTTPAPLLVEGQGFWFNELVGELSGANFTLRGYLAKSSEATQSAYINVVTHMASGRVKTLVASGSSYPVAITQAQKELVTALEIGPADLELGISTRSAPLDASVEAAYAMGLGVLFFHAAYKREGSTEAEFQQLLNAVQVDLADNGVLDGAAANLPAELDEMQEWLDVRLTDAFLRRYVEEQLPMRDLEQEPLPDMNLVIDSDRDGFMNAEDTCILTPNPDQEDSNNDGIGNACNFAYRIDTFQLAPTIITAADEHPKHYMCGKGRGLVTPQPDFLCGRYDNGVASHHHKVPDQLLVQSDDISRVIEFAAFENQVCARTSSNQFRCWFQGQSTSTLVEDGGVFGIFMNKGIMCWLKESMTEPPYNLTTGAVTCRTDGGTPTPYTGRFEQVVVRGDFVCGLTAEKKLACRTISNDAEVTNLDGAATDVLFEKIAVARTTEAATTILLCGLRAAEDSRPGEISCYDVFTSSQQSQTHYIRAAYDVLPGTAFTDVAVGSKACGIEASSSEIKCHAGEDPKIGDVLIPAGEFARVVIADDIVCGISSDGRPLCNKMIQPFVNKPR